MTPAQNVGSELTTDIFRHNGKTNVLNGPPEVMANAHGLDCTFASTIAVRTAKRYTAGAIRGGRAWRIGAGPGPLGHFGWLA